MECACRRGSEGNKCGRVDALHFLASYDLCSLDDCGGSKVVALSEWAQTRYIQPENTYINT